MPYFQTADNLSKLSHSHPDPIIAYHGQPTVFQHLVSIFTQFFQPLLVRRAATQQLHRLPPPMPHLRHRHPRRNLLHRLPLSALRPDW